jgi:hypothetical protein
MFNSVPVIFQCVPHIMFHLYYYIAKKLYISVQSRKEVVNIWHHCLILVVVFHSLCQEQLGHFHG